MRHTIRNLIARTLQALLRLSWVRTTGQQIATRLPWVKRLVLKFLYNTPRHRSPDKIAHQGLIETRLNTAIKQRLKGTPK